MGPDDLLDQGPLPRKKFNKNVILYALVTLCFIGFLFKRMHWPGAGILIIFGGGLSVGYICALLVYFRQHFFFENAGMILYGSFISFTIVNEFVFEGWIVYACTLLVIFLVTVYLLRDKEIV